MSALLLIASSSTVNCSQLLIVSPSLGRLVLVGVPSDWSIPSATGGLLPA